MRCLDPESWFEAAHQRERGIGEPDQAVQPEGEVAGGERGELAAREDASRPRRRLAARRARGEGGAEALNRVSVLPGREARVQEFVRVARERRAARAVAGDDDLVVGFGVAPREPDAAVVVGADQVEGRIEGQRVGPEDVHRVLRVDDGEEDIDALPRRGVAVAPPGEARGLAGEALQGDVAAVVARFQVRGQRDLPHHVGPVLRAGEFDAGQFSLRVVHRGEPAASHAGAVSRVAVDVIDVHEREDPHAVQGVPVDLGADRLEDEEQGIEGWRGPHVGEGAGHRNPAHVDDGVKIEAEPDSRGRALAVDLDDLGGERIDHQERALIFVEGDAGERRGLEERARNRSEKPPVGVVVIDLRRQKGGDPERTVAGVKRDVLGGQLRQRNRADQAFGARLERGAEERQRDDRRAAGAAQAGGGQESSVHWRRLRGLRPAPSSS